MRALRFPSTAAALLVLLVASPSHSQTLRSPEEVLGHRVGADYELARWPQIVDYFREIAAASESVASMSSPEQPKPEFTTPG